MERPNVDTRDIFPVFEHFDQGLSHVTGAFVRFRRLFAVNSGIRRNPATGVAIGDPVRLLLLFVGKRRNDVVSNPGAGEFDMDTPVLQDGRLGSRVLPGHCVLDQGERCGRRVVDEFRVFCGFEDQKQVDVVERCYRRVAPVRSGQERPTYGKFALQVVVEGLPLVLHGLALGFGKFEGGHKDVHGLGYGRHRIFLVELFIQERIVGIVPASVPRSNALIVPCSDGNKGNGNVNRIRAYV